MPPLQHRRGQGRLGSDKKMPLATPRSGRETAAGWGPWIGSGRDRLGRLEPTALSECATATQCCKDSQDRNWPWHCRCLVGDHTIAAILLTLSSNIRKSKETVIVGRTASASPRVAKPKIVTVPVIRAALATISACKIRILTWWNGSKQHPRIGSNNVAVNNAKSISAWELIPKNNMEILPHH